MKAIDFFSTILSVLLLTIVCSLIAGYVAIKGMPFSKFSADIINNDPRERVVYYSINGSGVAQILKGQSRNVSLSVGDIISTGFSSDKLSIQYHVSDSQYKQYSVFQDIITPLFFKLEIVNELGNDIYVQTPMKPENPSQGIGIYTSSTNGSIIKATAKKNPGTINIPVYTGQELRFTMLSPGKLPNPNSFATANSIFIVQDSTSNKIVFNDITGISVLSQN